MSVINLSILSVSIFFYFPDNTNTEGYLSSLTSVEKAGDIDIGSKYRLNQVEIYSGVNFQYYSDLSRSFLNKEEQKFYCSNEITLKLQDLGQVTGIVVDPKTKKLIKAKGVKVILQIDKSNRRGWSIKKAYPIK